MSIFAPLKGLRVLDLTRVLAGPYCTQLLGDWGAEVIKVERPGVGDDTRKWGPPFDQSGGAIYFHAFNRNKRSLALDFSRDQGREVLAKLICESDVFVENYIPGKLAKYGLAFDDVKALQPNIVYASLSGWGQEGKYAQRAGYDIINASFGGLLSITGHPDGPPAKVGVAVTDLLTGALTASAILAARQQPSGATWVQSSLLATQSSMLSHIAASFLTAGIDGARYGTAHPNLVPYQSFKTKNGKFLTVGAGNNRHFAEICELLELPDLVSSGEFKENQDRVENREKLIPILESRFLEKTADQWYEIFESKKAGFPYGPVI